MLERIDLDARIDKQEYQQRKDELSAELVSLQQQCIREKLPVIVCVDGWSAAGKGTAISKVVKDLDPRAFLVHPMSDPSVEERRFPLVARYWQRIGRYGTMTIFDRSWYTEAIKSAFEYAAHGKRGKKRKEPQVPHPSLRDSFDYLSQGDADPAMLYAESMLTMERQLIADRYAVIKCFFHVSKKEQKQRLDKLVSDPDEEWRVSYDDMHQNACYKDHYKFIDRLLEATDSDDAPWHLVPAENKRVARIAFTEALVQGMRDGLDRLRRRQEQASEIPAGVPLPTSRYKLISMPGVESISHDLVLDDAEYTERLDREQDRLAKLQCKLYRQAVPTMLVFEGWDAAGKGGAIKRVAAALDARDYRVVPSASPTPDEKERPFLWRYWTNLPKSGHMRIYDRSWYGRVMVERIEGFCTDEEWRRAYEEINDFEWEMHRTGALLLKFWVNISQDEQLARFNARKDNPAKAWKLTDEDWRNRDKYPAYRDAIDDMLRLTSTDFAPWTIVESDDKKYARIRVLETLNDAIEKRLGD